MKLRLRSLMFIMLCAMTLGGSAGLACAQQQDKIDIPLWKWVLEPEYKYIGKFYTGLSLIYLDDKYGYVDDTGRIVVEPQYKHMAWFARGGSYKERLNIMSKKYSSMKRDLLEKVQKIYTELEEKERVKHLEYVADVMLGRRSRGYGEGQSHELAKIIVNHGFADAYWVSDRMIVVESPSNKYRYGLVSIYSPTE